MQRCCWIICEKNGRYKRCAQCSRRIQANNIHVKYETKKFHVDCFIPGMYTISMHYHLDDNYDNHTSVQAMILRVNDIVTQNVTKRKNLEREKEEKIERIRLTKLKRCKMMRERIRGESRPYDEECMIQKMPKDVWQLIFSHLDDIKAVAYLAMTSKIIQAMMKKLGDRIVWKRALLKVYDNNEAILTKKLLRHHYTADDMYEAISKQILSGGCIGCGMNCYQTYSIATWKGLKTCHTCCVKASVFEWYRFRNTPLSTLKAVLHQDAPHLSVEFVNTLTSESWMKLCRTVPRTYEWAIKSYVIRKLEVLYEKEGKRNRKRKRNTKI